LRQPFQRALRGFNRRQVLEHLNSLDGRVAMLAADRDAALTQVAELSKVLNHLRVESQLLEHLRREADKAKSQVENIMATPMAEASARIQRILRLAEEEAAEIKARAQEEAAAAKTRAEAEAAARIARADRDIADLKARADGQITGLRARASSEAQSLLEHARRHRDQLEAEAAARREAAEHAAREAITRRESAASARLRGSELRSISRLHLMLSVIGEQLNTRARAIKQDESALSEQRAQVAREVADLEAARTEVRAAVAAIQQLLAETLGQIHGVTADKTAVEDSGIPAPPVPIQRTAESGTVYLFNTGPQDRRLPRAAHRPAPRQRPAE
jgi:chromosome segregation ATPase